MLKNYAGKKARPTNKKVRSAERYTTAQIKGERVKQEEKDIKLRSFEGIQPAAPAIMKQLQSSQEKVEEFKKENDDEKEYANFVENFNDDEEISASDMKREEPEIKSPTVVYD